MNHRLRIMYDDVPKEFIQKMESYLKSRGLENSIDLQDGKNKWIGLKQRENPQTIEEGIYYETDDTITTGPNAYSTFFHEIIHRNFAKKAKDSLKSISEKGKELDEGLAFMMQVALFGNVNGANTTLSDNDNYSQKQAKAYSRLLNSYYVFGDTYLKGFLENPNTSLLSKVLNAITPNETSPTKNWELAMQNPLKIIPESTSQVNGQDKIESYFVNHFNLPTNVAKLIVDEGNYSNLEEAIRDLSPSKTSRINSFHLLETSLFFLAGYKLDDAKKEAEKIIFSNTHEIALKGLEDFEHTLSVAYEIGGKELAEPIAKIVITQPTIAYELGKSKDLDKLLKVIANSRKTTINFTNKLLSEKSFRDFIFSKQGAEIISEYGSKAGSAFTSEYVKHLTNFDYRFNMTPDYNDFISSFTQITSSTKKFVDIDDQRDVLALYPKALATATISILLEGGRSFDSDDGKYMQYTNMLSNNFPEFNIQKNKTTSTFNSIFIDGILNAYTKSSFMIQAYNKSKEKEKTSRIPWQTTMKEYVDKFYNLTQNYIKNEANKNR